MPLELQNIKEDLSHLNKSIYRQISISYLNQFVTCPEIEEDKSVFLYSLLNHCEYKNVKSAYSAIMLVDLALMLHEEVPTGVATSSRDVKKRQLTVLGGDYYSSLYYFELAKVGDLKLIEAVASAIQIINEQKMNVYLNQSDNEEEFFLGIQMIHTHLFQAIANHLQCPKWGQFASNYFLLKKLILDLKQENVLGDTNELMRVKMIRMKEELNELMREDKLLQKLFSTFVERLVISENGLVNVMGEGL